MDAIVTLLENEKFSKKVEVLVGRTIHDVNK